MTVFYLNNYVLELIEANSGCDCDRRVREFVRNALHSTHQPVAVLGTGCSIALPSPLYPLLEEMIFTFHNCPMEQPYCLCHSLLHFPISIEQYQLMYLLLKK